MVRALVIIWAAFSIRAWADFNPLDYVMPQRVMWVCPYHPYFETNHPPERVRIDLSLDGGVSWPIPIAYGVPSAWGTNTYDWTMRVTPDQWSDQARIRIQTLWSSTTNVLIKHQGDMSDANITIAGIRIISPQANAVVSVPSFLPVTWHEVGSDYVRIGISTNGVDFEEQAMVASPALTNQFTVSIADVAAGSLWVGVASVELPRLWHAVRVQAQPIQ
jgi:hypothetical protein